MSIKVFYTASYYGKKKYQKNYDQVLRAIERNEVDIISPELGGYEKVLSVSERSAVKSHDLVHYRAIRKGIQLCDATIIEISNEDFQLGHEATLAILNKKPVLCLSIYEDFSKKIDSPYFHGAHYNEFNLDFVVSDFIKKVSSNRLDQRFNLFLSRTQLEKLEKFSKEAKTTKSEYLRSLIEKN
ncbi:hypothetical protein KC622_01380 [Candidatus Dojkabacteria bacterium]|uniref:Nucleoside 2-deoxyribosyltransferase n=1 Tax=Candidatus Dojkabacteria bacterium TaxID=2099670 RepID=A0A955HYM4_9BACT|nr:hypothetical protein [Candidatus Dojkabacteria bacterium]MCB9790560.1 hypothetical protein [Candidatus Nomurabacteria bacterium]